MKESGSPFGEVIYSYTSQQAAEDGWLVPVTKQDAVTRHVWDFLTTHTPMDSKPPNCWPVDMMGWFRAGAIKKGNPAPPEEEVRHNKALALARGLISSNSRAAIRTEEAGDIFAIYVEVANNDGVIKAIIPSRHSTSTTTVVTLWLRLNELGGVTLMLPEDN